MLGLVCVQIAFAQYGAVNYCLARGKRYLSHGKGQLATRNDDGKSNGTVNELNPVSTPTPTDGTTKADVENGTDSARAPPPSPNQLVHLVDDGYHVFDDSIQKKGISISRKIDISMRIIYPVRMGLCDCISEFAFFSGPRL